MDLRERAALHQQPDITRKRTRSAREAWVALMAEQERAVFRRASSRVRARHSARQHAELEAEARRQVSAASTLQSSIVLRSRTKVRCAASGPPAARRRER